MGKNHGVNRDRSFHARKHERVRKFRAAKLKKGLLSYKDEVRAYWQGEREAPPPKRAGMAA
jgi:hypothetical protein